MSNAAQMRDRYERLEVRAREILSHFRSGELLAMTRLAIRANKRASANEDRIKSAVMVCAITFLCGEMIRRAEDEERSSGA